MPQTIRKLDVVTVSKNSARYENLKSEAGTVIEVYEFPEQAFEVEFCDQHGRMIFLGSFMPEELELLETAKKLDERSQRH